MTAEKFKVLLGAALFVVQASACRAQVPVRWFAELAAHQADRGCISGRDHPAAADHAELRRAHHQRNQRYALLADK